jgi:hypothetical protein
MKKQTVNNIVRNMIVAVFSMVLFMQANANNSVSSENKTEKKIDIHYAGVFNEDLSFNVSFENPTGQSFTLNVFDEFGQSLYRANFSDKNFKKKFVVPKNESVLTFVIQVGKEVYKEKFDVNIRTRQIEDVIVKKG